MERSVRFRSPLLAEVPRGVRSCEHCRTVTWAGEAACGCEFARLAVDERAVVRLCGRQDPWTCRQEPVV